MTREPRPQMGIEHLMTWISHKYWGYQGLSRPIVYLVKRLEEQGETEKSQHVKECLDVITLKVREIERMEKGLTPDDYEITVGDHPSLTAIILGAMAARVPASFMLRKKQTIKKTPENVG